MVPGLLLRGVRRVVRVFAMERVVWKAAEAAKCKVMMKWEKVKEVARCYVAAW